MLKEKIVPNSRDIDKFNSDWDISKLLSDDPKESECCVCHSTMQDWGTCYYCAVCDETGTKDNI